MAERGRYITIRASETEAAMLRTLAEADGVSGSDVLRRYIRGAYGRRFPSGDVATFRNVIQYLNGREARSAGEVAKRFGLSDAIAIKMLRTWEARTKGVLSKEGEGADSIWDLECTIEDALDRAKKRGIDPDEVVSP
jgi:hypothetical protein